MKLILVILLLQLSIDSFTQSLKKITVDNEYGDIKKEYYALNSDTSIKHGIYHGYYSDGELMVEGKYSYNVKVGVWKFYSGELIKSTINYKNDSIRILTNYNKQGDTLSKQMIFHNLNKKYITYYLNNVPTLSQEYLGTLKIGFTTEYYETGNISKKVFYKHGKIDSLVQEYYDNGDIKKEYKIYGNRGFYSIREYDEDHKIKLIGQGKAIKNLLVFSKKSRHGNWVYIDPNGQITKIETWYNGSLIETYTEQPQ